MRNAIKLLLAMISLAVITTSCKTPVTMAIKNEDIAQTKPGDVLLIGGNTYTTKYSGIWMRDELDKKLHDAKYKRP